MTDAVCVVGGGAGFAGDRIDPALVLARAGVDAVRSRRGPTVTAEDFTRANGYAPSWGRTYRRMNPMNVRALRRSVRRINSAEKLFRKVFTITKGQVNVRKPRRSS